MQDFIITICRWMAACIHEELPPSTDLEESLRNGVSLAKLANFFAPEIAPVRKIFDKDLSRFLVSIYYNSNVLEFYHNVINFRLPSIVLNSSYFTRCYEKLN